MIENVGANQMQDVSGESPFKQPDTGKAVRKGSADAALQVRYASLINKAVQIPQTDGQAIKRARGLILSCELESYACFREAAENMVALGV